MGSIDYQGHLEVSDNEDQISVSSGSTTSESDNEVDGEDLLGSDEKTFEDWVKEKTRIIENMRNESEAVGPNEDWKRENNKDLDNVKDMLEECRRIRTEELKRTKSTELAGDESRFASLDGEQAQPKLRKLDTERNLHQNYNAEENK